MDHKNVVIDLADPTKPAVDTDGNPVGPPGKLLTRVLAKEAAASGDLKLEQMLYNQIGEQPPTMTSRFLNKQLTFRHLVVYIAASVFFTANESFGRGRHVKGRWWPTITDGFSGRQLPVAAVIQMPTYNADLPPAGSP